MLEHLHESRNRVEFGEEEPFDHIVDRPGPVDEVVQGAGLDVPLLRIETGQGLFRVDEDLGAGG